jgi:hypothetical protein
MDGRQELTVLGANLSNNRSFCQTGDFLYRLRDVSE